MAAVKQVRISEWQTENPKELKRQLRQLEDYVQRLQQELERVRRIVEAP